MVEGKRKSRSLGRAQRKTPGGKTVQHYTRRNPSKVKCSMCKAELHGLPRELHAKRLTKSQKTVARPYGANLCSKCMRKTIKESI